MRRVRSRRALRPCVVPCTKSEKSLTGTPRHERPDDSVDEVTGRSRTWPLDRLASVVLDHQIREGPADVNGNAIRQSLVISRGRGSQRTRDRRHRRCSHNAHMNAIRTFVASCLRRLRRSANVGMCRQRCRGGHRSAPSLPGLPPRSGPRRAARPARAGCQRAPTASNVAYRHVMVVDDPRVITAIRQISAALLADPPALLILMTDVQMAVDRVGRVGELSSMIDSGAAGGRTSGSSRPSLGSAPSSR